MATARKSLRQVVDQPVEVVKSRSHEVNQDAQPAAAKRARGTGDRITMTVRMTPAQWRAASVYAMQSGLSLQELLIQALKREMASTGQELP